MPLPLIGWLLLGGAGAATTAVVVSRRRTASASPPPPPSASRPQQSPAGKPTTTTTTTFPSGAKPPASGGAAWTPPTTSPGARWPLVFLRVDASGSRELIEGLLRHFVLVSMPMMQSWFGVAIDWQSTEVLPDPNYKLWLVPAASVSSSAVPTAPPSDWSSVLQATARATFGSKLRDFRAGVFAGNTRNTLATPPPGFSGLAGPRRWRGGGHRYHGGGHYYTYPVPQVIVAERSAPPCPTPKKDLGTGCQHDRWCNDQECLRRAAKMKAL